MWCRVVKIVQKRRDWAQVLIHTHFNNTHDDKWLFNFLIIKLDSTGSHKGSIRQNWAAIVPTRVFTASLQENEVPFSE